MAIDSDGEQDGLFSPAEDFNRYLEEGYSITKKPNETIGGAEVVLKKKDGQLVKLLIDEFGKVEVNLATKIEKEAFVEAAKRFLRLSRIGEQKPPAILDKFGLTSLVSRATDISCALHHAPENNVEGNSEVKVTIPNNYQIDRRETSLSLAGFLDAVGQGDIPRPLIHEAIRVTENIVKDIPPYRFND